MAKQTTIPKVDENFMREVISQGFPMKKEILNEKEKEFSTIIKEDEPVIETTKIKEPQKRKRTEQTDYRETYFEKVDLTDRQSLYITRETHLTLLSIVNVIGGHKVNISSYVENIILHHLESHKDEINNLYENKFKKPIS
ncbi:MAG: DUF3408 domain-containing protein [Sulfuricurvum sp.]|nr:DUF3408 domain-containing protein [Sulfuricurvum sp.]